MARTDGTSALKREGRFTLADWRAWPEGERWELIDGVAYAMSPSPRVAHQGAAFDLGRRLGNFLEGKPCRVFMAPLDVFLFEGEDDAGVVEPDVLAVCDQGKVGEDGIHGAPDFIAEVLSDSTAARDLGAKKEAYERAGVREYWIIHTETRSVFRYQRSGERFAPLTEFRRDEAAVSVVFEGFAWVCP